MPKRPICHTALPTLLICFASLPLGVGCGDNAAVETDIPATVITAPEEQKTATPVADSDSSEEPPGNNAKRPAMYSSQAFRQAAHDGKLRVVEICIESGLDVNEADPNGFTPLAMAAYNGHQEIVKLLLANNATVDSRDRTGMTPLIHAASFPSPETVKTLLDAGADINAAGGQEKWTALMMAAAEGNTAVVELLVAQGADVDTLDTDGESAAHFAREKGHTAIAEFLDAK